VPRDIEARFEFEGKGLLAQAGEIDAA